MLRCPFAARYLLAVASMGLLVGCSRNEAPDDAVNPAVGTEIARVLPAAEILAGADVPTLDPHTMAEAEIEKVIGTGPRCEFHYTSSGDPVLGVAREPAEGSPAGVVMLNGSLLALQSAPAESGLVLAADEVRFTVTAGDGEGITPSPSSLQDATLVFQVGDRLTVGYRGYYGCSE
jgi:hypothetical protein